MFPTRSTLARIVLATILQALVPCDGPAATHVVDNAGVDAPECGTKKAPCRSISQAIDNARGGDTIVVGPGRYGDLDGQPGRGPGDEALPNGVDMIVVDKPLTIVSRDGAATTVLELAISIVSLVSIQADDVTFGKRKKGFTLKGPATPDGIRALSNAARGTVAGNRTVGFRVGIALGGGHAAIGNRATGAALAGLIVSTGARAIGNEAVANAGSGILAGTLGVQIVGNLLSGNGGDGLTIDPAGSGHVVRGNVANANGTGFSIAGTGHTLDSNVASGNLGPGYFLSGTGLRLTGNAAVGNALAGVEVSAQSAAVTITKSVFIGNHRSGEGFRCAIWNFSPFAIDARESFWGAPTGPGPAPADQECNDSVLGSVLVAPFAPKPIKVKAKSPTID